MANFIIVKIIAFLCKKIFGDFRIGVYFFRKDKFMKDIFVDSLTSEDFLPHEVKVEDVLVDRGKIW